MVDWSRLSGERLKELIRIIDCNKDICGAERVTRDAIESLGEFRTGMAVLALVGLLDHPDEGHRATARVSLLRIRKGIGATWLDGSLAIIHSNAVRDGDRRVRRLAMRAWTDIIPPGMYAHRMLKEMCGTDEEDVEFTVRLSAKAPHYDIAERLLDIVFDDTNSDLLRMVAMESFASVMRDMDIEAFRRLTLMVSMDLMMVLNGYRPTEQFDFILSRLAEAYRNIAERIDDIAHGIDVR